MLKQETKNNSESDVSLSVNSIEVLKKRYLLKDEKQNVYETPPELFRRVSGAVARAEDNFKSKIGSKEAEEKFNSIMSKLEFLPNSPTLMNAGTNLGQLSACFVIPVEDSIDGMFKSLKDMAKIHQTGGGTGFSFSNLRPKGDTVSSTKGEASGPVSFMGIFDHATGVIIQGGRRRGANMGVLRCDHPDIIEFINAKINSNKFSNFNLSVGITDGFMDAVKKNKKFDLINPRTKQITQKVNARNIFNAIAKSSWLTGDPGLIFLDEINRFNPTPGMGMIEATNPCGELPLLPYESCNLGSINLARMLNKGVIDWEKLKNCIHLGIRFLDDVIEVNKFPLGEVKKATLANRKIGLGVMGFADMLIQMGISYNSKRAVKIAGNLMRFIHKESINASVLLSKERGVFPNFRNSVYFKSSLRLRNATVNTIAPTGTISIIAGCSSGIEPLFAVSFVRNVLSGSKLFEVNPSFKETVTNAIESLKKTNECRSLISSNLDKWQDIFQLLLLIDHYSASAQESAEKTIFVDCASYLEFVIMGLKDGYADEGTLANLFADINNKLEPIKTHVFSQVVQHTLAILRETDEYQACPPSSSPSQR